MLRILVQIPMYANITAMIYRSFLIRRERIYVIVTLVLLLHDVFLRRHTISRTKLGEVTQLEEKNGEP